MVKYLNVLLFVVMLVMNYLANALPLNNKTTGELSESFPNLFVPAGLTFSIWGVIYLLLLIYIIGQFTGSDKVITEGISLLFGISCILNATWIVCWHYGKLPFSLLVMICLLITLILINIQIRDLGFGLIKATFGIYLGWICIATIANATALLVNAGWNGFNMSQEFWTILLIFTGTIIIILTIYRINNPFVGLSVIWAFIGIALKRQNDFRTIFISAIIALTIICLITFYAFVRKGNPQKI